MSLLAVPLPFRTLLCGGMSTVVPVSRRSLGHVSGCSINGFAALALYHYSLGGETLNDAEGSETRPCPVPYAFPDGETETRLCVGSGIGGSGVVGRRRVAFSF